MSVMAIDTAGARALGDELIASAARADDIHGQLLTVMEQTELPTDSAARLAAGRDALQALGTAVVDKADLADSFTVDPAGTAAGVGAPEEDLRSAITALVGFAATRSLRDVLRGLPPQGADAALDAALARLTPALLPALLGGDRPELTAESHADLRTLALALGIASAGPGPAVRAPEPEKGRAGSGFLRGSRRSSSPKGGTEVFHHDFWVDGRTPQQVLDDPDRLLEWVSETFELDRRLGRATETPDLVDVLQTYDFATSADSDVDQLVAQVQESFGAISQYLPALLSGAQVPAPDLVQAGQIVAFATRVGWADTTPGTADDRLGDALAYLAANRFLASALLPSAFDANGVDLPFFDQTGIGFTLDLGVRRGLVDDGLVAGIGATVDAVAAQLGIDLSATTPPLVDEAFEKEFLTPLVAGMIGAQGAASPSIGLAFQQVLPYLRSAATGAELRDHLIEALAAFRTLAVVGVPALTERQLTSLVGDRVVDVLGRSRLRKRSTSATKKNPEFLALAVQWGIPGSEKIKTEDHTFRFSFDEVGQLTGISRKKRSTWSKIGDAFQGFIKGIGDAFEENPLKAIFEVGKIALNVAALIFPGTQALGIAAIAANAAGAIASAVEGDWLGALSNGLAAFTPGVGLGPVTDAISASQALVLDGLIDPTTLNLLRVAKSGVDTARAVTAAIDAESPLAAIAAGAQALSTGLGGLGLATGDAALTRLATTFAEVRPVIAGVGGTLAAVDQGDLLAAVGNGLGTLAAGATAFANPAGVSGLLGFDGATLEDLKSLAQTSGVLGSLANAVAAADRGDVAKIGSFLLQAVDQVTPDPALGVDPLKIATGIADLGAILERAVDTGVDSPALAGPVLQQLAVISASLNPKVVNTRRPPQQTAPPLPTRRPRSAAPPTLPGTVVVDGGAFGLAAGLPLTPVDGFLLSAIIPGLSPTANSSGSQQTATTPPPPERNPLFHEEPSASEVLQTPTLPDSLTQLREELDIDVFTFGTLLGVDLAVTRRDLIELIPGAALVTSGIAVTDPELSTAGLVGEGAGLVLGVLGPVGKLVRVGAEGLGRFARAIGELFPGQRPDDLEFPSPAITLKTRELRIRELAFDPQRGKVDVNTRFEADDAVDLQDAGILGPGLRRPSGAAAENGADFVDVVVDPATGLSREVLFDHKRAISGPTFDADQFLDNLERNDIRNGEKIILNVSRLESPDRAQLFDRISQRGLDGDVLVVVGESQAQSLAGPRR